MLYLMLFHGRKPHDQKIDDWGTDGPIFQVEFVHTTYACEVKINDEHHLPIDEDMLYYDGVWYGDWSVFNHDQLPPDHAARLVTFDQDKAKLPKHEVSPEKTYPHIKVNPKTFVEITITLPGTLWQAFGAKMKAIGFKLSEDPIKTTDPVEVSLITLLTLVDRISAICDEVMAEANK